MRRIAVAALLLLLSVPSATARPAHSESSVLTAVAGIGTVYWRYDCTVGRPQRWSLGVALFDTATTRVTLRVGRRTVRETMQPNERLWFALTSAPRQELALSQSTEAGQLHGSVAVDFGGRHANHCESYFPPRATTQVYPRR